MCEPSEAAEPETVSVSAEFLLLPVARTVPPLSGLLTEIVVVSLRTLTADPQTTAVVLDEAAGVNEVVAVAAIGTVTLLNVYGVIVLVAAFAGIISTEVLKQP